MTSLQFRSTYYSPHCMAKTPCYITEYYCCIECENYFQRLLDNASKAFGGKSETLNDFRDRMEDEHVRTTARHLRAHYPLS